MTVSDASDTSPASAPADTFATTPSFVDDASQASVLDTSATIAPAARVPRIMRAAMPAFTRTRRSYRD